MSKIKSLAEQLKSKLEEQKGVWPKSQKDLSTDKPITTETSSSTVIDSKRLAKLIESLRDFPMEGQEKILVRLDKRSMNMLRRFKVASNIDMTRVIVFSLHLFLKSHPWLNQYISQTLNSMTHELD